MVVSEIWICYKKLSLRRLLLLFILSLLVYLYLLTNAFDGMKTFTLLQELEGDIQADGEAKMESVQQAIKGMSINMAAVDSNNKPQTKQSPIATEGDSISADSTGSIYYFVDKLGENIIRNESVPLLTIFTLWTENPEKYSVHNITKYNWLLLRPYVISVLFTNKSIVANEFRKAGWDVFPMRQAVSKGMSVLQIMYNDVMEMYNTSFYAYSNNDILYTEGLVETLAAIAYSGVDIAKPVMIVGKTTNVYNVTKNEAYKWENIAAIAKSKGSRFSGYAEDFFITTRTYPWMEIADVAIGIRAYDKWLALSARTEISKVIDATETMVTVRQTTNAGNREGMTHNNMDNNHNLLMKMYKRNKYKADIVKCVEEYTKLENNWINLKKRTPTRFCNI